MKKYLSFILVFFCVVNSVSAQKFQSEADVLSYLNGKSFKNSEVGVTIYFSDMGTRLEINGIQLYSPDIKVVSETKAVCTYYRISNPDQKVSGILNAKERTWTDRSNGRVYKLSEY